MTGTSSSSKLWLENSEDKESSESVGLFFFLLTQMTQSCKPRLLDPRPVCSIRTAMSVYTHVYSIVTYISWTLESKAHCGRKERQKKIIKRETDKLSTCFAFNQDDLKVFLGCWHGQLCRGSFHKCTSYWSFVVKTVPQYFPFLFLNWFFFVVFFCRIACSVWWQFLEVITTEGMKDGWRQRDYGVLMLTDWS